MLGAHSAIHAPPEPHLLTPIAHLGYYERVADPTDSELEGVMVNRVAVTDLQNNATVTLFER